MRIIFYFLVPCIARYLKNYISLRYNKTTDKMKKTINVAIGGCSFTIDEDAYNTLSNYLERFKASLDSTNAGTDVMEELEVRIADLLKGKLGGRQVVDQTMTLEVLGTLGYPEGYSDVDEQNGTQNPQTEGEAEQKAVKKLFRDPDGKKIAGVCSGLSLYFHIDVVLIRVIFLLSLLYVCAGFWVYLVIWIVAPQARTAAEKCELRGIPATADNIRKFTKGA